MDFCNDVGAADVDVHGLFDFVQPIVKRVLVDKELLRNFSWLSWLLQIEIERVRELAVVPPVVIYEFEQWRVTIGIQEHGVCDVGEQVHETQVFEHVKAPRGLNHAAELDCTSRLANRSGCSCAVDEHMAEADLGLRSLESYVHCLKVGICC